MSEPDAGAARPRISSSLDVRAAHEHVSASANGAPSLAEQVAHVPTDPGCYLWKDAAGEVIYVGKAKNLRARMKQYLSLIHISEPTRP